VDQGDVPGGSPTSGPGPIPGRECRIWAGFFACVFAPIWAYDWAMPYDAGSLSSFWLPLVVDAVLLMAAFVIGRRGSLRFALAYVLVTLAGPRGCEGCPIAWPDGRGWAGARPNP
jgi:hypothetical protein